MKPINSMKPKTTHKYSSPFWFNVASFKRTTTKPTNLTNWEYFASEFEFNVWVKLEGFISKIPRLILTRQHEIQIISDSYYESEITWKVDFAIFKEHPNISFLEPLLYIEAKGDWILHDRGHSENFKNLIRLLSLVKPTIYTQLIVVGSSEYKFPGLNLITVSQSNLSNKLFDKLSDNFK